MLRGISPSAVHYTPSLPPPDCPASRAQAWLELSASAYGQTSMSCLVSAAPVCDGSAIGGAPRGTDSSEPLPRSGLVRSAGFGPGPDVVSPAATESSGQSAALPWQPGGRSQRSTEHRSCCTGSGLLLFSEPVKRLRLVMNPVSAASERRTGAGHGGRNRSLSTAASFSTSHLLFLTPTMQQLMRARRQASRVNPRGRARSGPSTTIVQASRSRRRGGGQWQITTHR